jgi:hypothetical protein
MKGIRARASNESGQVSIITVIVFILLFSVLVISFSRIMVTASRQAVNDELAASAKAAAESGIEDAKRILSYCNTATTPASDCVALDKPIEQSNCTTIAGNSALMGALQRSVVSGSGSSVKVGDANQEEYLCLKMTALTLDYLGSLDSNGNPDGLGESVIVPLKFVNSSNVQTTPKTIRVQWHNTSSDSDGSATMLAGSDLPAANKWGSATPAVLRAEFVAVPKTGFTIDSLAANTRAVTLRPSTAKNNFGAAEIASTFYNGASPATATYNLDSWIAKSQPNAISPATAFLLQTLCQNGSDGYACSVAFTIPVKPGAGGSNYIFDTVSPTGYNYYMRLQSVYQNTHFRLSAKDIDGRDLYFDHIQANVDVTGRASESQKRLSARLDPNNGDEDYQWWPDYVVDSAGKVCKNMTIEAWEGTDNCTD